MIYALLATALLLPLGDDPRLEPQPVTVRKRAGQWELRIRVRADFPDRTILNIAVQPRILRYMDTRKTLVWDEPEASAIKRRAQVRRKYAEVRVNMPTLQSVRVIYKVDPYRQRNGLKLDKPVEVIQDPFPTGSVIERLKALESGYRYTLDTLTPQLDSLISKLEKAAKTQNPEPAIVRLVNKVIQFREKCRRRMEDGAYLGTVGYLDYVSGDAITLCSWLVSNESKKPSKQGGGQMGDGNQGQESPGLLDDPEGTNEGGNEEGGAYSEEGLKEKGAGNIRTESFTRIGKLLDIIPNLHRAETFFILLSEARIAIEAVWEEKAVSTKVVATFRKALDFVEKQLEEERLPVITMGLMRRVQSVLEQASTGILPSEASVKELINTLEAEERKVAQVS